MDQICNKIKLYFKLIAIRIKETRSDSCAVSEQETIARFCDNGDVPAVSITAGSFDQLLNYQRARMICNMGLVKRCSLSFPRFKCIIHKSSYKY